MTVGSHPEQGQVVDDADGRGRPSPRILAGLRQSPEQKSQHVADKEVELREAAHAGGNQVGVCRRCCVTCVCRSSRLTDVTYASRKAWAASAVTSSESDSSEGL